MIFKYLSQEFNNNILDLVKKNGFYPCDFEKFKEELFSKEKFCCSLTKIKISYREYEHVLNVWKKFEMKMTKDYHNLYLKCDVLLSGDVFEKSRNNNLRV